ncbi:MAG TPA: PP2C family protein-serine/threonine phosphatase [Sedimentisphaerales bacterium]|nr:PP2C family protein-serine/threonine phosphatase [Sedimentisphaerales bacterium]
MKLFYEWGTRQFQKYGEELCGDNVAIARHADSVTLALSDGLGSGVKANILSMLTSRIVMHLMENELPLPEVVETLSRTLPVCEVRNLAYSTFAIGQFFSDGRARVVEFDTPPIIVLRRRRCVPVPCEERQIEGKTIRECEIDLEVGDFILLVSDGVLNAGIGGLYPLGWGFDKIVRFLEEHSHQDLTAQQLADKLGETVRELYCDRPGDDVSVVVVKARRKLVATILTGPPVHRAADESVAARFAQRPGLLAVCGGTTAQIVARYLGGKSLEVDLATMKQDVPPLARLQGIDLITEGILTLTKTNELLQSGADKETVQFNTDGASALLRLCLDADHIHFMVGLSVNPAHQNPDLPAQLGMKLATVRSIAEELRKRDKEVTIETV